MDIDWKSLPSLSALRAFNAAAGSMSFSQAARSLNVTPAAISQQVRLLETELGLVLVRREGRGIALTEYGTLLALSLEQGFGAIVEGIETLREVGSSRGVRVTTTPLIVDEFLLTRMTDFWQKCPGVEVSLMPSESYQNIVKHGFDLAIRGGEGDYPRLNALHLIDTKWIAVASPKLIKSEPVDLNKLPWIADPNLDWEVSLMRSAGLEVADVDIVNLGDARHTLRAAREGYGATIANAFIVRNDVASGRLEAIDLNGMPRFAYWAVVPPGPVRPPVAEFIDWLKIVFAEEAARFQLGPATDCPSQSQT